MLNVPYVARLAPPSTTAAALPHVSPFTKPAATPLAAYALTFATYLADGTLRDLVVGPAGQTILALTRNVPNSSPDEISLVRIGP